ncbi:Protein MKS1 [Acorus calamus]|uniref:Protein MKS1 n=1 Tax=Acorus calamus TaxID=4465 RepID=A0AAV9EGT7_ACOCL|nr:Protein MKS1 [Acorus calamus]
MSSSSSLRRFHHPMKPSPHRRVDLQGPRPSSPLLVHKDSHKICKPSTSTGPVIIYTVSPKVIHVEPAEFMSLVQSLTGRSSPAAENKSSSSSSSSPTSTMTTHTLPSPISPTLFFHGLSPLFHRSDSCM